MREIQKAFETIQKNVGKSSSPPAGHISADVLEKAFRCFGPDKLDEAAAKEVTKGLGADSDGFVNYETILRMLDPAHIL